MNRIFCLFILLVPCLHGFAQDTLADDVLTEHTLFAVFNPLFTESLESAWRFEWYRPLALSDGPEADQPIFANAPQWVKDLRRGEIVFFGSLPFTVFFSRTIVDLYRTATHDWDRRYAPWPMTSAGAVTMNTNELIVMFSIAASASVVISVVDYFIVQKKRKTSGLSNPEF